MQQLIDILKKEPIVAADLAAKLNLFGSRETQRRKVRALIKELRDEGQWIVASLWCGYFLTSDFSLWRDYLEGRKIDAKRIFAEVHKRKKVILGQRNLF